MIPQSAPNAAPQPIFRDRSDAGRLLARSLTHYASERGVVVIGLTRGGVPVAREVAAALGATFGVMAARRIGVPGMEEIALGAIAEGSPHFVANAVLQFIGVPQELIERLTAAQRTELERQASLYRSAQAFPDLRDRTVVLIDDGLATGATLRAAVRSVRRAQPKRVVAAVPVASRWGAGELRDQVDELVVLLTPPGFELVGACYRDFQPVTDDDVVALLGGPLRRVSATVRDISERLGRAFGSPGVRDRGDERTVLIPVADGMVAGELAVPTSTTGSGAPRSHRVRGLAILAHPNIGGRNNYRERYLAGRLRLGGYATLRLDLATSAEHSAAGDGAPLGANADELANRLTGACDWAIDAAIAGAHRIVLIGSAVGGAVSLIAAAQRPGAIWSVITRGARVELAAHALTRVRAPVLLIVSGADRDTLVTNAEARRKLRGGARIMPMAHVGRAFDEPGALGALGEQVMGWLERLETRPRVGSDVPRR